MGNMGKNSAMSSKLEGQECVKIMGTSGGLDV